MGTTLCRGCRPGRLPAGLAVSHPAGNACGHRAVRAVRLAERVRIGRLGVDHGRLSRPSPVRSHNDRRAGRRRDGWRPEHPRRTTARSWETPQRPAAARPAVGSWVRLSGHALPLVLPASPMNLPRSPIVLAYPLFAETGEVHRLDGRERCTSPVSMMVPAVPELLALDRQHRTRPWSIRPRCIRSWQPTASGSRSQTAGMV
jgi:hypothetical protein